MKGVVFAVAQTALIVGVAAAVSVAGALAVAESLVWVLPGMVVLVAWVLWLGEAIVLHGRRV